VERTGETKTSEKASVVAEISTRVELSESLPSRHVKLRIVENVFGGRRVLKSMSRILFKVLRFLLYNCKFPAFGSRDLSILIKLINIYRTNHERSAPRLSRINIL